MSGILVVAELKEDKSISKASLETASEAVRCGKALNMEVTAVVVGAKEAQALAKCGIKKAITVEDERLADACIPAYTEAITQVAKAQESEYVFFPATLFGKGVSSVVAAKFETAAVTDCTELITDTGEIVCKRPVYAGKAIATVKPLKKPGVISLRPNVFPLLEQAEEIAIEETKIDFSENAFKVKIVERKEPEEKQVDLTQASIIVSGGRGMKGPEHFPPLIHALAKKLGGAYGASRAVVDAGWRPHKEQVGQTGKTVSPQLYIACGISGAIQHLAGMRTSKTIVAINKDEEAPIFQIADYGIVGDAFEVLPKMLEEADKLNN